MTREAMVAVLVDAAAEHIWFVRDPFGLSTLYYAVVDDCKVFSTNLKDMVALFPSLKKINVRAIGEYLTFNHIAGTSTIFADIRQIEAGTAILVDPSGLKTHAVWRPTFNAANVSVQGAIAEIDKRLRHIIDSVFSDKAGLLLSGGIDSSLLCSYLAERTSNLATFSVSIPDYERNDEPYFLQVSNRYRTQQTTLCVGNDLYARNLSRAIWHMEEPLLISNSVAVMLICEVAKANGYDLLITGEGCDGLFSGGSKSMALLKMASKQEITEHAYSNIALSYSTTEHEVIRSILADGYGVDLTERRRILAEEVDRSGATNVKDVLNGFHIRTYTEKLARKTYRMSAASAVTTVSPFLSKAFTNLLFAIPHEVRHYNGIEKYPLVELCGSVLGQAFASRPKVGFNIPIGRWFRAKEGLGTFRDVLLEERTIGRGFYKVEALRKSLQLRLNADNAPLDYLLWGVLNLELWIRTFIEEEE